MKNDSLMMIVLAGIIVLIGLFLAVKGKPHMIRERFSKGVSKENERKFMMTIGGGISIIGADMLVLGLFNWKSPLSHENILSVLAVGVILFVAVIAYGQKRFRR